jgi:hypothetical protein
LCQSPQHDANEKDDPTNGDFPHCASATSKPLSARKARMTVSVLPLRIISAARSKVFILVDMEIDLSEYPEIDY